ncbi:hypothetical protein BT63DRAFT_398038 [Microthyrium microscopicum]|uniref:NACHT domain-containing protein n=1 Tax=Microthyrium microscopicum TaxID=703497 RepID=A0A6A6UHB1_9PEZI|nr:hypothetical protein BT63DRAFT_398038 [Microthyrium microscopicum]
MYHLLKNRPGKSKRELRSGLVGEPSKTTQGASTPIESATPSDEAQQCNRRSQATSTDQKPPVLLQGRTNTGIPQRLRDMATQEAPPDPLGLELIYEPEISPPLDIIFVHGIGGTSRSTWTKDRHADKFWPKRWLPNEPGIQTARILSFGYNAVPNNGGPNPLSNIGFFARALLEAMKELPIGHTEDIILGQRPIIFIVHSLGGLVVKQAYLYGHNDSEYRDIISSISAIIFLATPNRSHDMESIMERILTVSVSEHPVEYYRSSGEIWDGSELANSINEQFRHFASRLEILSYYETLSTPIARHSLMVLDQTSAEIGTHAETSVPLEADHNSITKFNSSRDSNYVHIKNGLKLLMRKVHAKGIHLLGSEQRPGLAYLESFLAVPNNFRDDLQFFRKRWTPGTCLWILSNSVFEQWRDEDRGTSMLWLHALPGSGKSILSSFVIHHLQEEAFCVYYFFRFGDASKRSLSTCLRVLAFQIADRLPQFRRALQEHKLSAKSLEKADAKTIWDKVFREILFRVYTSSTLYWIIDALDEADHPRALIEMLTDVSESSMPIKILLVSRQTPDLVTSFERLKTNVPVGYLPIEDTRRDIRNFLEDEVKYLRARTEFKTQIVERLVAGAGTNFLWARLAFDEVRECNTQEDLDETLESMPTELTEFYQRMEDTLLESLKRPRDQRLGQEILTWAVCSRRPLSLGELVQALQPDHNLVMDAKLTINRVCGQFVIADATDHLVMVHQTARDHVLEMQSVLAVNQADGHERLFKKCLSVLETRYARRESGPSGTTTRPVDDRSFMIYAATSWPYHLDRTSVESETTLLALSEFLRGYSVLSWITALASNNLLRILVSASKSLSRLARAKRIRYSETNPMQHRWQELDDVESWAIDLLKLLGKFGDNLLARPSTIYNQIPPFCPRNTTMYRWFEHHNVQPYSLSVKGLSKEQWDDSLARLSLGPESQALTVLCSPENIAVLTGVGQVVLYSATTFEKLKTFAHTERVCAVCFSSSFKSLATYGFRTTKVWDIKLGKVVKKIQNPRGSKALNLIFAKDDTEVIAGSDDRLIRSANLNASDPKWEVLHPHLLKDEIALDRPVHKVPWRVAFTPDAAYMAVAYRAYPLSVFSLDPPELIGRNMRNKSFAGNSWTVVDEVLWHPNGKEILGIYMGGEVFRWNPFDHVQQELDAEARYITCSLDGSFFATGDRHGALKIFNYEHFTQIYHLSVEGLINNICFSPDGKRLFDVRGHHCNVWEPNALLRVDGGIEQDSDVKSDLATITTRAMSKSSSEVRDQITAIGIQIQGRYQAVGNEKGVVSMVDSLEEEHETIELWKSPVQLSIGHLNWSGDGDYLACAGLAGRVVVKKVQQEQDLTWTASQEFEQRLTLREEGIRKIMLNDDGSILFVQNGPEAMVFHTHSQPVRSHSIEVSNTAWIEHPSNSSLLMALDVKGVSFYKWDDLQQSTTTRTDGSSTLTSSMIIDRVLSLPRTLQIVINYQKKLEDLSEEVTSFFDLPTTSATSSIIAHDVPVEVQKRVELPLGILPVQGFIFLDKDYWLCSYKLGPSVEKEEVKEYYFLPKDWWNVDCLKLCTLLANGTLLIPNNGELAVIKCTALR